MPKEFNDCYQGGGRVRTESLGSEFRRVCYDAKGRHAGHRQQRKTKARAAKHDAYS